MEIDRCIELLEEAEKEIESLRSQLEDERKHSDIILQQRDESIGDLSQAKEDIESLRKENKSIAEEVAYLVDHYRNGIAYDEKRNEYICIWTEKQIEDAKRAAEDLCKKLGWNYSKEK